MNAECSRCCASHFQLYQWFSAFTRLESPRNYYGLSTGDLKSAPGDSNTWPKLNTANRHGFHPGVASQQSPAAGASLPVPGGEDEDLRGAGICTQLYVPLPALPLPGMAQLTPTACLPSRNLQWTGGGQSAGRTW